MLAASELWHILAVAGAGLAAGAANAVAGGGSAISFPVLVMVGIPPIAANATNAAGLVPGSVAASWSYRGELRKARRSMLRLALPSLLGGAFGAWLLIELPPTWFAAIAPWLVLAAAASVPLAPVVRRRLDARAAAGARGSGGGVVAWAGVSVYGGYFGAGMGLLMLTALGLLGVRDLQHANGLKNLLSVVIKAPAVAYFIVLGLVRWWAVAVLLAGAVAGGWIAGHLVQRVEAERLRWLVAALGGLLGALMLVR